MMNDLGAICLAQGWRCFHCQGRMTRDENDPAQATRDHLVPVSRGGTDEPSNAVASCRGCNQAKGPLTGVEYEDLKHDPAALAARRGEIKRRLDSRSADFDPGLRPPGWSAPLPVESINRSGRPRRWTF